jgi:hypothetical protein
MTEAARKHASRSGRPPRHHTDMQFAVGLPIFALVEHVGVAGLGDLIFGG